MYSPTYADLSSNLLKELDLEDETFITPQELLNYFNEAVDMVESAVHTIYEDYFLTSAPLSLINGQVNYALPSDIYAQKLRGVFYSDGSANVYCIKRIKNLSELNFLNLAQRSTILYQYLITNDATAGLKMAFYPTPTETSNNVTLWYLRNAKRFSGNPTDVCDIPEFTAVVIQYVRWKCLDKEGHPSTMMAAGVLQTLKQEMVDTLTARVPDEDNLVQPDWSFYNDFDNIYYWGGY